MKTVLVTSQPDEWNIQIPRVTVVTARDYLTNPVYITTPRIRVYNLCRSYRYQTLGYYVSLLAEARGHKPIPNVSAIQDMKWVLLPHKLTEDFDPLIQRSFRHLQSNDFVLSIYFGKNVAETYTRVSQMIAASCPFPLLRAHFRRVGSKWKLTKVGPITVKEVPESHWGYVQEFAKQHFERASLPSSRIKHYRYDLAILYNENDDTRPSNPRAIERLTAAGNRLGMRVEIITRADMNRIAQFDALFIRETTNVMHYTFQMAQRAEKEGLVVIDDPASIIRCSNKIYLHELLRTHSLPSPATQILTRQQLTKTTSQFSYPLVLKQPDGCSSKGVTRVESEEEFLTQAKTLFESSDLLIAQEFVPTDFDWRVGVLGGRALFVCRYHMAKSHWKIAQDTKSGSQRFGRVDTLSIFDVPSTLIDLAVSAANLIGKGFYGVDIKERNGRFMVIEVNDNPNLDAGYEDKIIKKALYDQVMEVFLTRLQQRTDR